MKSKKLGEKAMIRILTVNNSVNEEILDLLKRAAKIGTLENRVIVLSATNADYVKGIVDGIDLNRTIKVFPHAKFISQLKKGEFNNEYTDIYICNIDDFLETLTNYNIQGYILVGNSLAGVI